jgi:hypothetical protein
LLENISLLSKFFLFKTVVLLQKKNPNIILKIYSNNIFSKKRKEKIFETLEDLNYGFILEELINEKKFCKKLTIFIK